jgi:soluble lytic murein transglycosylase-like protein
MLRVAFLLFLLPAFDLADTTFRPPELHNTPTIEGMILSAAIRNGIDPELVLRLAWRESNLRSDVVGHNRGSIDSGVMQLNSRAVPGAEQMSTRENIDAGVSILAMWLERCRGNRHCAIEAYGRGHIRK